MTYIKKLKNDPGIWFITKVLAVYGVWILVRSAFKKTLVLRPIWDSVNDWMAEIYVNHSAYFLKNWFKYSLSTTPRNVLIEGTNGIYIGDHCLGISAIFIFIGIIAVLDGRFIHKIWFIPSGVFAIYCMNLFRAVTLGIMQKNEMEAFFHFNHSYTYLLLIYGLIFLIIISWEKTIGKWQ